MLQVQPVEQSDVVHCQAPEHEPVDGPDVVPLTHPRAPQKPQPACSVQDVQLDEYAAQGSLVPQSASHAQPVWQPPPVSHAQELPMHAARSAHAIAESAQVRWSAVDAGQSVAHDEVSIPAQIAATWLHTVVQLVGVTPPPPRRPLLQDDVASESAATSENARTRTSACVRCMSALSPTRARPPTNDEPR